MHLIGLGRKISFIRINNGSHRTVPLKQNADLAIYPPQTKTNIRSNAQMEYRYFLSISAQKFSVVPNGLSDAYLSG